jgi:chromosome segregation ATPase
LTRETTGQLNEIDSELSQVQTTLASSRVELERALRIVDASEQALEKLAAQSTSAENILDGIQSSLDDRLLPELKTTRERINTAREALESLQAVLDGLGDFLPGLNLGVPNQIVTDLIDSAKSMDAEITHAEEIAKQASTFVSDTS